MVAQIPARWQAAFAPLRLLRVMLMFMLVDRLVAHEIYRPKAMQ